MKLDIEDTLDQLKKIFSNSIPSKRLYPITDEQKLYVRKLNVIFDGFYDYLNNECEIRENTIDSIMDDIELFLQSFHLDYSEIPLSELDAEELSYYFQDFLPRNLFVLSKSTLKSMCKSLKLFLDFLREKLKYYHDAELFKKMTDALNADQLIKTIYRNDDQDIDQDNDFENEDEAPTYPSHLNAVIKILDSFRSVREERERSEMELKKKILQDSIKLEVDLNPWHTIDEIKVGNIILKEVFKNFHNLKTINKNGLLAAIDYALCEIFLKQINQNAIAKRHNTSPVTLINNRYIIAPYIPLKYFYPLFISEDDIKLNKEKTYIFKINNYSDRKIKFYSFDGKKDLFKIELAEFNMLHDLHIAIQSIIGDSDDDHLYSFFMNGKEWDRTSEYAGPPDFRQERCSKYTDIPLKELNLGYKQRFLYLYDYADSLRYNITVVGLGIYNDNKTYPHRIK